MNCCKILSWNARGLCSIRNRKNLRDLINRHQPNVVCIQESLLTSIREEDLKFMWPSGSVAALFQPANGHSGGLVCAWNSEIFELSNFESLSHCLGFSLKMVNSETSLNVFNIYGPHSSNEKKELWNLLKKIHFNTQDTPSLFIGDFNCVRSSRDRCACVGSKQEYVHFNQWVEDSNLHEVCLSNAKFTWIGPGLKKSRLDRAFINAEWARKGSWKLIATARKNSDHRGILLVDSNTNWGAKPFRVFNVWLKEESLIKLVEDSCQEITLQGNTQTKIKRIKQVIKEWNSGTNGNVHKNIEILELEDNSVRGAELENCKMELEEQYLLKDSILKKQAIILRLKEGDRNTKLFHQALQRRKSRNNIKEINVLNKTISKPVGIKGAFFQHYKINLLKGSWECCSLSIMC